MCFNLSAGDLGLLGIVVRETPSFRETEVSSEKVNLYIPAEKCCVYEDEKLI